MKNSRFPARASRVNGLFSLNKARVVLLVTLLAGLSALPFYVFAQSDEEPVKIKSAANYRSYGKGQLFVIAQGPDGNSVCRPATAEEARVLRAASGGPELHQINHLEKNTANPNSTDSPTGLTIILRATAQLEANPAAKQAFINAAAKWEALIKDPITINVDVDFGTTFFGTAFPGPSIIGQTQSQLLYTDGNYAEVRQHLLNHVTGSEGSLYGALPASTVPTDIGAVNTVVVATPLLRALGLLPSIANDSEQNEIGLAPRIGFNSAFGFDFDPSNGITNTLTDFDAVATHEMGHLLGFHSSVGDRELDPRRFSHSTSGIFSASGPAQQILVILVLRSEFSIRMVRRCSSMECQNSVFQPAGPMAPEAMVSKLAIGKRTSSQASTSVSWIRPSRVDNVIR